MTAPARRDEFPPSLLADIRARTPLPAFIGRGVRLARQGGVWTGCCPFHAEKNPSFAVYPDHYHCFGCGAHGDAIAFVMRAHHLSFPQAVRDLARDAGIAIDGAPSAPRAAPESMPPPPDRDAAESGSRAAAMRMWLAAQPNILDTPVENYLANRGIDLRALDRLPRALRFHPDLWHAPSRTRYPAMVAAITSGAGEHVATHRTWLEYAGGGWVKARIQPNKMVLGHFPGGSIHLWRGASGKSFRHAPPGESIVIGEGIESCLSVVQALPDFRVLAAVSQGNLGGVEVPAETGQVILLIDNDQKPTARANAARHIARWIDRGFNVRIARSPAGNDFNDVLTGG